MAKTKPKAAHPWRNRIVGHGSEAPDQLLANPRNWRVHPRAQQDALSGVLSEVGWVQQVLVNQRTGHVVDGHLRVSLAISRGEPFIPVTYLDLSEAEEAVILATFDPIGALAGTDQSVLDDLLRDAVVDDPQLVQFLAGLGSPKPIVEDEVPPVPAQPITRTGDLWLLGEHRLLCGDACSMDDHERLLGDAHIDVVLTDPPYGVGLDYGPKTDDSWQTIERIITECLPLLRRWAVVTITSGHRWLWRYPEPTWLLAWVHPAPTGRGPWGFTALNPILVYGVDPYLAHGRGSRNDALILAADREGVEGHPAPKPLAVWSWLLERTSANEGELVLDPFVGSGTTLIAAEQLGRRCYAIEIEPSYCDVAVKRWENFTGRTAVRETAKVAA